MVEINNASVISVRTKYISYDVYTVLFVGSLEQAVKLIAGKNEVKIQPGTKVILEITFSDGTKLIMQANHIKNT